MIVLLFIIPFLLHSISYAMNISPTNHTEPSLAIQLCLTGINNNSAFTVKSGLYIGADVNYCDENGKSLFFLASQQKDNTDIIKELIAHKDIDPSVSDINGNTPLHKAYEFGLSDIAKNMHDKNPHLLCNFKGNSHLHTAIINGKVACIKELLPYNLDIINYQNCDGNTPIHLAILHEQLDIVDLLIQNTAASTIKNNQQQTPLATLFFTKQTNQLINLYQETYNQMLYIRNNNKDNQLHLYATTLLPEKRSKKHCLIYLNHIIKSFRSNNFDIHAKNKNGKRPVDVACEAYDKLYQQYMLTKDADLYNIVTRQEYIMHVFLCAFSPYTECVLFKETIKDLHPEICKLIMHFYYLLNLETIAAKTYIYSDNYYDNYIEVKEHLKKSFIEKPQPKLLWEI